MKPRLSKVAIPGKIVTTAISFSHGQVIIKCLGQKVCKKETIELYKLIDGSPEGDLIAFFWARGLLSLEDGVKIREELKQREYKSLDKLIGRSL